MPPKKSKRVIAPPALPAFLPEDARRRIASYVEPDTQEYQRVKDRIAEKHATVARWKEEIRVRRQTGDDGDLTRSLEARVADAPNALAMLDGVKASYQTLQTTFLWDDLKEGDLEYKLS